MMTSKRIGQGRTAEVFEQPENRILKLYRPDFPEDAVQHEFQTSSLAYSMGVRTPKPYEQIRVEDRKGVVFQRIRGKSLLALIVKKPWTVRRQAGLLARLHADLHTYPAGEIGRKQKAVLRQYISAAPLLTEEEKKQVLAHLESLPEEEKLCHGDFHPDNVLYDGDCWIVDWMTGMSGNPAGDAARSVVILGAGTLPDGTPRLIRSAVQRLRGRLKKSYVEEYLKVSGIPYPEIEQWIMPVAAARLVEWLPPAEKDQLAAIVRERLAQIRQT